MAYTNSAMQAAIAELIHSERDRKLLSRRLIDGITVERLAEEFDMSVSQVKRIIQKCSEPVFAYLQMN